jgi:hypothetical protein
MSYMPRLTSSMQRFHGTDRTVAQAMLEGCAAKSRWYSLQLIVTLAFSRLYMKAATPRSARTL